MEVFEASVEDASVILAIQKEAYISEAQLHDDFEIPPLTQTLAELEAEFGKRRIVKIVIDGKIVASGQATLFNSTCQIGRMAVTPQLKGKGIGSTLLSELELSFREANRIELFTGINSTANLAMYSHRGYKPFKQKKLGCTTLVFLEKLL
ncbi:Histone acetyltransferase HPA2 [Moritella sp. JT01]|uniref:GNAT family N-acetyltransferase n=1 Tax=Moritella sp. JT01 TaxID=756698 RepID=UPI0007973A76|nr:GNAT family N-acetyltransferase [Moritella sp. JT01]KXO09063.1 Histone acetyltransferase HPA2 [Moritella sp. JT01]